MDSPRSRDAPGRGRPGRFFRQGLSLFPIVHITLLFTAAFYLLFARRWPACGMPLLAIALLTAWGRVYGGIHFPFDMVGSLMAGLLSVGLMRLTARQLMPLNERLIRISK